MFQSRVGSFLTAPDPREAAPLRFVVSGDSNVGFTSRNGLDFYVLAAAAAEQPDFFVYYGDTIYADSGVLPGGADAITLEEYRTVHRLTRSDPHLQEILATTGTFSGWDDHEVRNDYDGETVEPEARMRGPAIIPSSIARLSAKIAFDRSLRSRTVVNPARSVRIA